MRSAVSGWHQPEPPGPRKRRMSQAPSGTLKQTALNARHRSLGARMVEFGGWDMPVEYSGIADEHLAVRTRAGLFDVSHMGQIEIAGADALKAVQHITSNDASRLSDRPGALLGADHAAGHVRGRRADVPAGGRSLHAGRQRVEHPKDFAWITAEHRGHWRRGGGEHQLALRADRDPGARRPRRAADADRRQPGRYQVLLVHDRRGGRRPRDDLAHRVHGRGRVRSLRAAGVGRPRVGRDSRGRQVRPESCRLASARATRCGSKRRCVSTATTSTRRRPCSRPISDGSSAGRRTRSSGADVLRRQKAEGVPRKLVGFEMLDRAIARHGYDAYVGRPQGRRRDERDADAVSQEGDRHGVPAGRSHGRRHANSRSTFAAGAYARRSCPMPFYKRATLIRADCARS